MPPSIIRPGPEQDSILPMLRGAIPENLTDVISIEEPEIADDQIVFNLRVKLTYKFHFEMRYYLLCKTLIL